MISIKNKHAQELMAQAGKLLAQLFQELPAFVQPGRSTADVDAFIEKYIDQHKMISCTKGFMGYRHASCISINDEVVHGVPSADKIIKEGDLVKVDVCASYLGYCADMARGLFVGTPSAQIQAFMDAAQRSLDCGIEQAQPGKHLTDISAAIQLEVESHGYGIVRDFAGHGIGKKMHEDPEVLNYGKPGCGPIMKPGMAFAIEPMITMGNYKIFITPDKWTVKTVDHSLAAHVEDTVIITDHGPLVITRL